MYMKDLYNLIAKDFRLAEALFWDRYTLLDDDDEATVIATAFGRAYFMKDLLPIDNKKIDDVVHYFVTNEAWVDAFLLDNIFTDEVNALTELVNDNSITSRVVMAQIIHVYSLFCALKMCAPADDNANQHFELFKSKLMKASSTWVFNEHLNTRKNNFINSHSQTMPEDFKQILNNVREK